MANWSYLPGIPTNLGARPGIPHNGRWIEREPSPRDTDVNNNYWSTRSEELDFNHHGDFWRMFADQVQMLVNGTSKLVQEASEMKADLGELKRSMISLNASIDSFAVRSKTTIAVQSEVEEDNTMIADKTPSNDVILSVVSDSNQSNSDGNGSVGLIQQENIVDGQVINRSLCSIVHIVANKQQQQNRFEGTRSLRRRAFANNYRDRYRKKRFRRSARQTKSNTPMASYIMRPQRVRCGHMQYRRRDIGENDCIVIATVQGDADDDDDDDD